MYHFFSLTVSLGQVGSGRRRAGRDRCRRCGGESPQDFDGSGLHRRDAGEAWVPTTYL